MQSKVAEGNGLRWHANNEHDNAMPTINMTMLCQQRTWQCYANNEHDNAMPTMNMTMQCQQWTWQCYANNEHDNAMPAKNMTKLCFPCCGSLKFAKERVMWVINFCL